MPCLIALKYVNYAIIFPENKLINLKSKSMNAILIARVSTEEQKEAELSLPAQVRCLETYCQNKNFSIINTFSFDESA